MGDFNQAVEYVLLREGGLEENNNDPGGITNFGISLRFLTHIENPNLYPFLRGTIDADTVKQLTREQAKALYKAEFWDHMELTRINNQNTVNYIFDMAINMGIAPAIKCAQRACWACYQDSTIMMDDGILGDKTLHYLNQLDHIINYLLYTMRSERAGFYRLLVANNASHAVFINGWLARAYNL